MTDRSSRPLTSPAAPATRRFLQSGVTLAVAAAVLPGAAFAQGAPAAGAQYRSVKPAQPTESGNKIEVIEFFWYGCPHCNALEPALVDWVKRLPPDVAFRKVHVPFNEKKHQQLFYALDAMGKAEELTPKVFAAIHGERNRLDTVDKMTELLGKHGVDAKVFKETFDSFSVQTKVRKADAVAAAWGVDSVPMIGVNGKYLTAPSMAGSNGGALQVAEFLIDAERKARK